MVVVVDLESEDDNSSLTLSQRLASLRFDEQLRPKVPDDYSISQTCGETQSGDDARQLLTRPAFAAALACYPVALSLSSHLDLNDLHSLSLTCHCIHDSLAQYASHLISRSLRCTFDSLPLVSDLLHTRLSDPEHEQRSTDIPTLNPHARTSQNPALTTKICACAQDLVAECRKCGTIVCRNCTGKAPSNRYLTERHRRLCRTCLDAPLVAHLTPLQSVEDASSHDIPPMSSSSSARSASSVSGSSLVSDCPFLPGGEASSLTAQAFLREPCLCASRGVYLCNSCGHNLRSNDTTYGRVWTWRSRYSTHIGGGLGTGLGLGDQGQKCGRGDQCLDTSAESISWVEIDCSDGAEEHDVLTLSRTETPLGDSSSPGPMSNKLGYFQQEIEGIGGVRKKKIRKRVKVGATVWEYDDERKTGKYLEREASGVERSWCGWCGRVCLGEKDRQGQISS